MHYRTILPALLLVGTACLVGTGARAEQTEPLNATTADPSDILKIRELKIVVNEDGTFQMKREPRQLEWYVPPTSTQPADHILAVD